jgi:hypothetical protein
MIICIGIREDVCGFAEYLAATDSCFVYGQSSILIDSSSSSE